MSDNVQPAQPAMDPNITKMLETVEAGAAQLRQKAMDDFTAGFQAELAKRMMPNRSVVEQISDDKPKPRETSRITITPAEDAAYRLLPDSERKYRKPVTDHYIAEWIRGMAQRDGRGIQRMMIAEEKLADIARADTLEGTITAVALTGAGTGGSLLPLPFSTLVVRARDKAAKLRRLATKFMSESVTLRVPVSSVSTAAMAAEGAVAAQGEPTFTTKLFTKKKMQANMEASREMLNDSALNLVTLFSERAGSAFGALEDVQVCTSNGTAPNITQSLGSATITAVTEATSTVIVYGDLQKMFFALPQQYRDNACWFASSTVLALISSIGTASQPALSPIGIQPSPVSDDPGCIGTIFGKKVYDVPLVTTELFFGDPSQIGILEGGGIEAQTNDAALWAADSIAFRFTTRWDGLILLEDSFRQMEGLLTANS